MSRLNKFKMIVAIVREISVTANIAISSNVWL